MSIIEDLRWKYSEMDEIDRRNLWLAVGGVVLFLILIYTLSNTFHNLSGLLGRGASFANDSVSGVSKLGDLATQRT